MYKPSIFISHSAKDPAARQLLARLYTALDKDFEVLLDRKRLHANNEWRKELNTWIGLCQGAVALLSKDALDSRWVLKETTNLGYRREMDDRFILIPILVPPVDAATLAQGDFAPLELGAIQAATGKVDEIVDEVLETLKPLKDATEHRAPLRKVERAIGKLLFELSQIERAPVLQAANILGTRLLWRSDETYAVQLARLLLSADLEQTIQVLQFLADSIPGSGKKLVQVLNLLSPFWVDPDAVSELPRMNTRPRRQRAVKVNGVMYPFTGKNYIRRASVDKEPIVATVTLPAGWQEVSLANKVDLLVDEILRQLQLGFEDDERPNAAEIERRLRLLEAREPMFVLVPKDFDEDVLSMLRQRLDAFTFFMLGEDQEFKLLELQDWKILWLKPELTPGMDEKFFDLIGVRRSELQRAT